MVLKMTVMKRMIRNYKYTFVIISIIFLCVILFHQNAQTFRKSSQNDAKICFECDILLKFLYAQNVFLIDFDKLKEISAYDNASYLELNTQTFLELDNILWFGVFQENIVDLLHSHEETLKCNILKFYGQYNDNDRTLTLIILKCNTLEVGIHVFLNRGDFLYITAPSEPEEAFKWFNDVPRAVKKYVVYKG
jgi:hypothetical protein